MNLEKDTDSHGVIGVGVIGLGFMGQTHLAAYQSAERSGYPCRVVAVSDRHEERRRGERATVGNIPVVGEGPLFDSDEVRGYSDPNDLFTDPNVDLVSVCTPTDTHFDLVSRACDAGKHVLIEKPVSLDPKEIEELDRRAKAAGIICMPAMCMRFWPGWRWLKEQIELGGWGRVLNASFRRTVGLPAWSKEFYLDPRRSGGALFDLHVHDVDFAFWCFGKPNKVHAFGAEQHVQAIYEYDDGPNWVRTEGGWVDVPGFEFQLGYQIVFEAAVVEFDSNREPALRQLVDSKWSDVECPELGGYDGEIRHLIDCIQAAETPDATLAEAAAVTRILVKEQSAL